MIESEDGDTVLTGNRLPISPDLVVNGGVTFTPIPQMDVTFDVKHVGDVAMDQTNTFVIDPYTLVDAALTWRHGPLRITISGHNLFDEAYCWGGDTSLAESADPGRPRQILTTVSVRFR